MYLFSLWPFSIVSEFYSFLAEKKRPEIRFYTRRAGFGAAPSARLAPSRLAGGAFCGHQDHLGQVQSPWRSREAIKKYFVWTALSRTVRARTQS